MSPKIKKLKLSNEKPSTVASTEVEDVAMLGGPNAPENGVTQESSSGQQTQWQRMISEAVHSIVSIRFSQVAAFDTEQADTSEGLNL
jgi:hypothetical protein